MLWSRVEFLGCKMGIGKKSLLFSVGGLGYVALELLWRGRSHSSMFLAGGSCFLLLGRLQNKPPVVRALGGAGIITAVELLTGLLANRSFRVWDYRDMPLNFKGQICLPFSLLWVPVGLAGSILYGCLDRMLTPKKIVKKYVNSQKSENSS